MKMRKLFIATAVITTTITTNIQPLTPSLEEGRIEERYCRVAPPNIKRAHRYHGITSSWFNPTTRRFEFVRDGVRCKLFTEGFSKHESQMF